MSAEFWVTQTFNGVSYGSLLFLLFAQAGRDMLDGFRMGFEQAGYQAGGRKVELIEEDTEGNPATAQAKYRTLVGQDKIHVMAGILLVNVGYGLAPVIERDRMPSLFLTTPDDLTKRRPAKYILRANFSASQPMHALGDYAAKVLKYKRVAAIAMDNGFGYEGVGGFQRVFEDNGGNVVQKTYVPLNAMDFAPYLTPVLNGRLQNTIIHTYPMVSQFWTYKPDEFLKTPAYDRNYPPIK